MKKTLFISLLFINAALAQKPQLFDQSLNQFLNVRDFTIDQNEIEAYFTVQSPDQEISQIVRIDKKGEKWSEAVLLPFCDEFKYMEPFLSHDKRRLYFASDKPSDANSSVKRNFDIWYVERPEISAAWSEPVNIGRPVNSDLDEFYPSVAINNNLYFTLESPDGYGKDDVYFSEWKNGAYLKPALLDSAVNSSGYEFNAFVSGDEKFMLYTKYNEPGGAGSGDLYISRKGADGKWQKAVNMGLELNTKFMEYCPFYNPATETLYFTGRRNFLPSRKFKDLADFQSYILNGENGLSKIYRVSLKLP